VILVEPPRTAWDVHFRLFSVPVRVHPLFWLVTLLIAARPRVEAADAIIFVIASFVSILIHELGHAAAIAYFGWRPRITLYSLGGLASYDREFSDTFESYSGNSGRASTQIIISLAGPVAGFLFAAVIVGIIFTTGNRVNFSLGGSYGIDWAFGGLSESPPNLIFLLDNLLFVNIFWGLINLLPIYPLDGGQIARELFTQGENPRRGLELSLQVSLATAGIVAVVGGIAWRSLLTALLFGYLAYISYATLRAYRASGGFSGGYDDDDGPYRGRGW
jgi:stage IV sporulation protein FB